MLQRLLLNLKRKKKEAPKVSREDFLDAWNDGKWRIEAYKIKAQHDNNNNLDTQMDQDEEFCYGRNQRLFE